MKKTFYSFTMIVFIVTLVVSIVTIFSGQKTKAAILTTKEVGIKIISVSKEKIEIEIKNSSNETFVTTGKFVLKKKKNGKWEEVKFKPDALFAKTVPAYPNSSLTITLKWKDYFWKDLSKGEYKIEFIKSKKFEIIDDNMKEIPFKNNKDKWITEIDEDLSLYGDSVIKQLNMKGLSFKMAWNISITMRLSSQQLWWFV